MIDIRCHVLDESSCGPSSFAESLEMCRKAADEGVRTISATLQWNAGREAPPLPFQACQRKVESLEKEMKGKLSLQLGFVLELSPLLPELLKRYGSILGLGGGRHLMVSMPALEVPSEADEVFNSIAREGYKLVLAHPECNAIIRRDSSRLDKWIGYGLTLQVDAGSLCGTHGREVRRTCVNYLRKYRGRVVVGSNSHGISDRAGMDVAFEGVKSVFGARLAFECFRQTPAAIIGKDLRKEHKSPGSYRLGLPSWLPFFNSAR